MDRSPLRPWTYFPLGVRAYRDTFRFTGRSRRLEVMEFALLSMVASAVLLQLISICSIWTGIGRCSFGASYSSCSSCRCSR